MNRAFLSAHRVHFVISGVYFLCACLYFIGYGLLAIPLSFLTLCAFRYSSWPMMLAMLFSAFGDWMGIYHNFWGQMSSFAIAHVAFIVYFCRAFRQGTLGAGRWKWLAIIVYGMLAGGLIVPHVQGVLQIGVTVYLLLILTMCGCACMQKNPYYACGAWLFVVSDTVLSWNKFVSPIEFVGYFIMIPYYLGQWMLFITSIAPKKRIFAPVE